MKNENNFEIIMGKQNVLAKKSTVPLKQDHSRRLHKVVALLVEYFHLKITRLLAD